MRKEPIVFYALRLLPWYSFLFAFLRVSERGLEFVVKQMLAPAQLDLTFCIFVLLPFGSLYSTKYFRLPHLAQKPIYGEIVLACSILLSIVSYIVGIIVPRPLSFEALLLSSFLPVWKNAFDVLLEAIGC